MERRSTGIVEWTPANVVTTARILLIPLFVVLLLAPWGALAWEPAVAATAQPFVAMAVFALIALTDSLDGYLARSRNEITVFGKFMDPIADKVLVIAALVGLVELGSLPSWIPIVIIARELLVSGLRMLVASVGTVIAAGWIGKAKTFTTMVAICLFIIMDAPVLAPVQPWFSWFAWALMAAAVVLTVVSMADYFAKSWRLLTAGGTDARKPAEAPAPQAAPASPAHAGQASPACAAARPEGIEGRHPLAADVLAAAKQAALTLGTAESCTGGLVAAALTSVPGSSEQVAGGVVSYMVPVKERLLGVPGRVIADEGVVSAQTAAHMAEGARTRLGADIAVSTTGVAGPGGGGAQTPVGTVWFGLATPQGTLTERRVFCGARDEVRSQAVDHALGMLLRALGEAPR